MGVSAQGVADKDDVVCFVVEFAVGFVCDVYWAERFSGAQGQWGILFDYADGFCLYDSNRIFCFYVSLFNNNLVLPVRLYKINLH